MIVNTNDIKMNIINLITQIDDVDKLKVIYNIAENQTFRQG